jgi:hypothetical protein
MFAWLAAALLTALAAILALGVRARRVAPPPARRNELIVDWTREWRRALNSLDSPVPGERRPRQVPSRSSSRAS